MRSQRPVSGTRAYSGTKTSAASISEAESRGRKGCVHARKERRGRKGFTSRRWGAEEGKEVKAEFEGPLRARRKVGIDVDTALAGRQRQHGSNGWILDTCTSRYGQGTFASLLPRTLIVVLHGRSDGRRGAHSGKRRSSICRVRDNMYMHMTQDYGVVKSTCCGLKHCKLRPVTTSTRRQGKARLRALSGLGTPNELMEP